MLDKVYADCNHILTAQCSHDLHLNHALFCTQVIQKHKRLCQTMYIKVGSK